MKRKLIIFLGIISCLLVIFLLQLPLKAEESVNKRFQKSQNLTETEMQELYKAARDAAGFSYSPYSKFPVGAAVLTEDGNILKGTNVENASYGLAICAERVAVFNSIVNGHRDIRAIALYAEKGRKNNSVRRLPAGHSGIWK